MTGEEVEDRRADDVGVGGLDDVLGVADDHDFDVGDRPFHRDHLLGVAVGVVLAGEEEGGCGDGAEVVLGVGRVDDEVGGELAEEGFSGAGLLAAVVAGGEIGGPLG